MPDPTRNGPNRAALHGASGDYSVHYTAEDVTDYLAANTIFPFLLAETARHCPGPFAPDGAVWRSLREAPDRYVFASLRHGVDVPLPAGIAEGVTDPTRRGAWDGPAAPEFGLPGETWRAHVGRRERCRTLRHAMRGGRVSSVDELVTLNLDLRRFALDVLDCTDEPALALGFWRALQGLTVLDPTCGAGAFLLAAVRVTRPLIATCLSRSGRMPFLGAVRDEARALATEYGDAASGLLARGLHGVDILPAAVRACRRRLLMELQCDSGPVGRRLAALLSARVRSGDALSDLAWWQRSYPGPTGAGGFAVVLSNPPYLQRQAGCPEGFETASCGDVYACVLKRAYGLLRPAGRLGAVVPVSVFGADGFAPLQRLTLRSFRKLWVCSFANRPSQLFEGAQNRLSVVLGVRGDSDSPQVHTGPYLRWRKEERPALFATRVRYVAREQSFLIFPASLEKLGSAEEVRLFDKLRTAGPPLRESVVPSSRHRVYYTRKFGYFLSFLDAPPAITELRTGSPRPASELRSLGFRSADSALSALAALSSSTFFWFWNVVSDGRNLNRRDLLAFPFAPDRIDARLRTRLAAAGRRYLAALRATSRVMKKGGLAIETFDYPSCKPLLDDVDRLLAGHFGLSGEELDFLLSHDLPYRTGAARRLHPRGRGKRLRNAAARGV